jgi:hypothetical protein
MRARGGQKQQSLPDIGGTSSDTEEKPKATTTSIKDNKKKGNGDHFSSVVVNNKEEPPLSPKPRLVSIDSARRGVMAKNIMATASAEDRERLIAPDTDEPVVVVLAQVRTTNVSAHAPWSMVQMERDYLGRTLVLLFPPLDDENQTCSEISSAR